MKPAVMNGCFNREWKMSFKVRDGYEIVQIDDGDAKREITVPKFVDHPHRMSTDCRYDLRESDNKCVGCKHLSSN